MTAQMYKKLKPPAGKMKLPRPYIINGNFMDETPCVVKLSYGAKYVIVKCKKQHSGLKAIEKALAAYLRGNPVSPGNLYRFLFEWVKKHPEGQFTSQTLLSTENGYQLLKKEQEELDKGDKNCLNWELHAYVPEYNPETEMYGWIKKNEFLNFKKWLATRWKATKKLKAGK